MGLTENHSRLQNTSTVHWTYIYRQAVNEVCMVHCQIIHKTKTLIISFCFPVTRLVIVKCKITFSVLACVPLQCLCWTSTDRRRSVGVQPLCILSPRSWRMPESAYLLGIPDSVWTRFSWTVTKPILSEQYYNNLIIIFWQWVTFTPL